MKILLLLLCLVGATSIFAQREITNDYDRKVYEVKSYVLKNLKTFHQLYSDSVDLEVEISLDSDSKNVDTIGFAVSYLGERKPTSVVDPQFLSFLKTVFLFNPSINDPEDVLFPFTVIRISMNANELKTDIKNDNNCLTKQCSYKVKPNAKFKLTIEEIFSKPFADQSRVDTIKALTFKSQLIGWKSNVFQINEDYFLYFSVNTGSSDDACVCHLVAQIYFVHDGVADLIMSSPSLDAHNMQYHFDEKVSWKSNASAHDRGYFDLKMHVLFK